jgi:hypothetical protein
VSALLLCSTIITMLHSSGQRALCARTTALRDGCWLLFVSCASLAPPKPVVTLSMQCTSTSLVSRHCPLLGCLLASRVSSWSTSAHQHLDLIACLVVVNLSTSTPRSHCVSRRGQPQHINTSTSLRVVVALTAHLDPCALRQPAHHPPVAQLHAQCRVRHHCRQLLAAAQ